jgi:hypothetical protein
MSWLAILSLIDVYSNAFSQLALNHIISNYRLYLVLFVTIVILVIVVCCVICICVCVYVYRVSGNLYDSYMILFCLSVNNFIVFADKIFIVIMRQCTNEYLALN